MNNFLRRLRGLPTGNYMVRLYVQHDEKTKTTTAHIFTENKTLVLEIPEKGEPSFGETQGVSILPAVYAA